MNVENSKSSGANRHRCFCLNSGAKNEGLLLQALVFFRIISEFGDTLLTARGAL